VEIGLRERELMIRRRRRRRREQRLSALGKKKGKAILCHRPFKRFHGFSNRVYCIIYLLYLDSERGRGGGAIGEAESNV